MTVTAYRIDPDRSTVTAVARPMLDGRGALAATMTGRVEVGATHADDQPTVVGEIHIRLDEGPSELDLDVTGTRPEIDVDRDGLTILRGSATRPVGALGLTGPPLLNPTIVLRWHAVLVPDD
jgi:hypothetical protein